MVEKGFRDAGYTYVTLDDCWPARERDKQGRLQPDPLRFPNGIKYLADYLHSKGLKLGLYEDIGTHTCAGFPGTQGHWKLDAQTYADWGVDMIKFDGCNSDVQHYDMGFPLMAKYLNQTGRQILYSCEWPLYERAHGVKPNYTAVAEACNTFRVYGDIYDARQSIMSVVNWYGENPGGFLNVSGPGHWSDGDMITLGNYGLSHSEERTQIGMWAIFASPLLMSVDIRTINDKSRRLLQHRGVLSISQDSLGIPGRRILNMENGAIQVWVRPLAPRGTFAIATIYTNTFGYPIKVSTKLSDLGLKNPNGYNVTEVFDGIHRGEFRSNHNYTRMVKPTDIDLVLAKVL
ncbi:DgyrCDS11209 [Dimorphilus gyrociliatus]|nr:DgyrCDS11209 [Dimorphilus gyrociliatus]